ncbi:TPA: SopA family protein [Escherichia coli]|nr:SopA family protein [Escherichia coli]
MIGHITNSGGNNSLMKHCSEQENNITDLEFLRVFNMAQDLKRNNFIFISNLFLGIEERAGKDHSINMFREVSISGDILSVKFYRNEEIECACNFLMEKDEQGFTDLSGLDLTSCHFKGDVISKVYFRSSNLQRVIFECEEIENCNFTKAAVNNVIFKCRRLHNVNFFKASGKCVDFSKTILDEVEFCQSHLTHSNFRECQIGNSNFDACYLYDSHFTRAEFLSDQEISFVKSNLKDVVFDNVRMSTGNFTDCITDRLVLTIDYSELLGNKDVDGYFNNLLQMIDTLPNNAAELKSVLAVNLLMQLKILDVISEKSFKNMKKTFSRNPYVENPIIYNYIHPDQSDKFDIFMHQHQFKKVNFNRTQMIYFINKFNKSRWLIDKNNNFFIQLIDQALRTTDHRIVDNAWHLYKQWVRSDKISPLFKDIGRYLRTLNTNKLRTFYTNQLTQNDNIFILFSSVEDGPVMLLSSQRLQDMLNPTENTHWNPQYIYKSRHDISTLDLDQVTLFDSKSHDEHALFPIFTAGWRATHKKKKGI